MSDRIAGYYVVLDEDIREDAQDATLNAIRQIKGVRSVKPKVAEFALHAGQERAKHEIWQKILNVFREKD